MVVLVECRMAANAKAASTSARTPPAPPLALAPSSAEPSRWPGPQGEAGAAPVAVPPLALAPSSAEPSRWPGPQGEAGAAPLAEFSIAPLLVEAPSQALVPPSPAAPPPVHPHRAPPRGGPEPPPPAVPGARGPQAGGAGAARPWAASGPSPGPRPIPTCKRRSTGPEVQYVYGQYCC